MNYAVSYINESTNKVFHNIARIPFSF